MQQQDTAGMGMDSSYADLLALLKIKVDGSYTEQEEAMQVSHTLITYSDTLCIHIMPNWTIIVCFIMKARQSAINQSSNYLELPGLPIISTRCNGRCSVERWSGGIQNSAQANAPWI